MFWVATVLYLGFYVLSSPEDPSRLEKMLMMSVLGLFSATIMAAIFAVAMLPIVIGVRALAARLPTSLAVALCGVVAFGVGTPVGMAINYLNEGYPPALGWPSIVIAMLLVSFILAAWCERKGTIALCVS